MATLPQQVPETEFARKHDPMRSAFFWLSAFYVVYCVRPEDWIPGLPYIPLAKVTSFLAFVALLLTMGRAKRSLRDLPREAYYLIFMVGLLFVSGALSPIWRGGGISRAIDFSKVLVAWVLTFLVVTDFQKLRRLVFIQAACVPVISLVSIVKGHSHPRLQGVLGGIYSDPNDLAFAIVLSLPFCLMFLLSTKSRFRKFLWLLGMLVMGAALLLTASRAGFIDLIISFAVCLWHFGVRGRRPSLLLATACVGGLLLLLAGGRLKDRFLAMTGTGIESNYQNSAYESYEERRYLMIRSLDAIERYPLFGLGIRNFTVFSGNWKEVHASYLQIAAEGGIPALILYLLFFARGFSNLKEVKKIGDPDPEVVLMRGALHSSLVGFVVGACFAPEAYQFFPYFAVAYTSVLLWVVQEKADPSKLPKRQKPFLEFAEVYVQDETPSILPAGR
jgi:O-antigen ligase